MSTLPVAGIPRLRKPSGRSPPTRFATSLPEAGCAGGAGAASPPAVKWKFARAPRRDHKYLICNADEGDPGAFMDRAVARKRSVSAA